MASLGPMLSQTAPEKKFAPWHISSKSTAGNVSLSEIPSKCMHYLSKKDSSLPVAVGHGTMGLN